jgi:hypothetical protein
VLRILLFYFLLSGYSHLFAKVSDDEILQLYVGTFNRAADADGLEYWKNDSLPTQEKQATAFFNSDEAQNLYPPSLSNDLLVNSIYNNLFNRDSDADGLKYWVKELTNGNISRSNMLLAIMEGAKDDKNGNDKTTLINKVEVGKYFAQKGLNNISDAKNVMSKVTDNKLSVVFAKNDIDNIIKAYKYHKNISTTIFWVGEDASKENANIANIASAWDDMWMLNYGGVDTPDTRNAYLPSNFTPNENSFYFALPYNDFDENGKQKGDLSTYIPWVKTTDINKSVCKNRWIKIIKNQKVAYAQWEDVGPFGEDDKDYVFGTNTPKNSINNHAGLDVSPAVRDYLNLSDIDNVDWVFVDEKDVPDGPWKNKITTTNINWTTWYKPDVDVSWQWQLTGTINKSYDVEIYDIDLFDSSTQLIESLQNDGKKVICYFSAGSYENWRDDKDDFADSILGDELDGWDGERWLDISKIDLLKPIMETRLDLAKEKGCDGVEPDNMDGYTNNTGFSLNYDDQLAYNKFIANEARKRGLSVGLKNDLNQIVELEPYYDFSVNEQCHIYNECDKIQPFIDSNKPVLNAEYAQKYINDTNERENMCNNSKNLKFKTLVLPMNLDDSFRYDCNENK